MAPSSKKSSTAVDRRKGTSGKPSLIFSCTVSPSSLRKIISADEPSPNKEESLDIKDTKNSSSASSTVQKPTAVNGATSSDSGANTPAAGTPAPQPTTMGPPPEGPKKKGVKRGAAALDANGEPKPRGKPGPKRRKNDEDGEKTSRPAGLAAHKLGPKANQGAINAGLRALDRSGKPCRKWSKGGFTLKSFTGTVWEIPRWVAPPKPRPADSTGDDSATVSADASVKDDSNKENKENGQLVKSDTSNNGVEAGAETPQSIPISSPAPVAVAVA